MTKHKLLSVFRPSSSHRQLSCTKSILHDVDAPFTSSTQAQLGTKIHYLSEQILLGKMSYDHIEIELEDNDNAKSIISMINRYDDYIYSLEYKDDESGYLYVEMDADLSFLYNFTISKKGSADAVIYHPTTKTLHIVDLKTGRNEVSAYNNPQLNIYAWVIYQELKAKFDICYIETHIFQSLYTSNNNSYATTPNKLENWVNENIIKGLDRIKTLDLSYKTGSHCKYCPNINNCPALFNEIDSLISTKHDDSINDDDKSYILNNETAIIDTLNIYKTDLEKVVLSGIEVAGVKMVRGNKRSFIPHAEIMFLEDDIIEAGLSPDDLYNKKLKTPNQIKEMLIENDINIDLNQYIQTNEPALNLVVSTNSRKEVKIY